MNNLTRVLMSSASAAAIMFGVHGSALADTLSVGGGTITYGAGGVVTNNTPTGGVEIQTIDNDTVDIGDVTINKTASGPTSDALNIVNSGAGTLNVTFSGSSSQLSENSSDAGAALTVDNSAASGAVSLDTSGACCTNEFDGANGIVVKGTGYANVVLGADNIVAIADGTGSTTAGLSVSAGFETDIATAANIQSDGTHNFDYGINLSPSDPNSLNFITVDAVGHIAAATADINITNGSVTIDQYGTLDTATNSIVLTGGGNANINLYAGSTTGNIDLTGDGGGSIVSLYTGQVNANPLMDAQTGQIKQYSGTRAAAVFGNIAGSGFDELDLRGGGDGTGAGGAVGQIDLSSTGGISGFGVIGKKDTGTWQFLNAANDAATNQSPTIYLEQGTIQAMAGGAFGGGNIVVDNAGGASVIEYSASGVYGNAIVLNVSSPTLASGAHVFVDSGITANLTGAITDGVGAQTLVFNGPGTAVLSSTGNTWSGGTQISGNGIVSISSASNIGTGAITLGGTSTSGTLEYTGGSVAMLSQNVTLSSGGGTFKVDSSNLEIGGIVSGTGNLTKSGAGMLILDGNNTYTGVTTISAGTLQLGSAGSFPSVLDGSIASSSAVRLTGATAVLDVSRVAGGQATIHNLSGVSGSQVSFGSKGLTVTNDTATVFAGSLTGVTGNLTINGNGSLALTGANTYSGLTIISSGELDLTGSGSLASGNNVEIDGGTFDVETTGQVLGTVTGAGGNLIVADSANLNATAVSGNHTITLQGNSEFTLGELSGGGALVFDSPGNAADIVVGDATNTTYSGNISSITSGTGAIFKEGTGTLTLGGDNSNYTGYIQIDDGTLQAGSTKAFGGGTFNSGPWGGAYIYVGTGATLDLNGFNNAFYSLHGPGTVTDSSTTPVTLELYNGSSGGSVFSGTIEDGAGKTSVLIDAGTLTLTGTNTYTGGTTVASGAGLTLNTGGSLASGANVAVNGGSLQVLNGVGQAFGALTGTGGSIILGDNTTSTATSISGTQDLVLGDNASLGTDTLSGNGTLTLGNSELDTGMTNANATYAGNIVSNGTGNGFFIKEGTGTLTLSGDNSGYSGYFEVDDGGVLQAGSSKAFGGGTYNSGPWGGAYIYVNTGSTLDLNGFSNAFYSLHGPGTVTDSSTTPVTLELYSGSNPGSVFSGVIQDGAGKISLVLDSSTLTMTGANTYSGSTTIASGAGIVLTGNGSIANSSVIDNGSFDVSGTTTPAGATVASLAGNGTVAAGANTFKITNGSGVFSGVLDGTGGLVMAGGAETLSGANTYTGGTTVTGGILTAGTANAFNGSSVTVTGGGVGIASGVTFAGDITLAGDNTQMQVASGTATETGVISESGGSRSFDKTGNGTLVIDTAVTYTGATIVDGGTLRAGAADIFATSTSFIVAQGATLDFGGFDQTVPELSGGGTVDIGASQFTVGSDNASTTFSGVISGTGTLIKTGTGTLTLSGDNTYSGGTIIQGGTVDAESDHAFGTGSVTMQDPILAYGNGITIANKVILAANDVQFSVASGTATQAGVVSETGGARPLEKIGSGELVLSGTNTYTGATTVTAGTLTVDGSIASSSLVSVKSGATLGGSGTVGDVTVAKGATFAPGSSDPAAALTVKGDLKLAAGSNFVVAVNPTSASQAKVSGTATLGGATVDATYGSGSYVQKEYTLLTAGSIDGSFASTVNSNLPSNFETSLKYDDKHAYLELTLSFVPPSPPAYGNGLSHNQNSVGNTLVDYFNRTGGIPLAFGNLTAAGLTAVSGEVAVAAAQTAKDAQDEFLNAMLNPALAGRGDTADMTADGSIDGNIKPAQVRGNPWHVWGGVYGGGRSTDGSASVGSSNTNAHNYGAVAGVDYVFDNGLLAGVAGSIGNGRFSVAHSAGSGHADNYQIGAYAHQDLGTAGYVTGAVSFGSQDVTTHRTVDQSGVTGGYRGHYSADTFAGRLEGGWRLDAGWAGLTPYVAWQATSDSVPGYSEKTVSGSNTFALSYRGTDFDSSRGEVGLRADHSFDMEDGLFMLRGHAAWADNFQIDHAVDAGFQALPGTAFTVQGAAEGRNVGLAGLSGEWKWNSGMSLVTSVDGAFSDKSTAYVATGAVRFTW
ncbi:MAG TPA: autotransporter-associated beta strand repeat-containing protein [Rhizomicrobium sp.]